MNTNQRDFVFNILATGIPTLLMLNAAYKHRIVPRTTFDYEFHTFLRNNEFSVGLSLGILLLAVFYRYFARKGETDAI